jgi:hypothetical protein
LFLFVLASLIRFKAAFLVLLITLPIFLQKYFKTRKIIFDSNIKILIITIAICLGCKAINYAYYHQNQDWVKFSKYNAIRGKINDNPNARPLLRDLPEGISKTDYMLLLVFHSDPKIIDYGTLKKIKAKLDKKPNLTKIKFIFQLRKYRTPLLLFLAIAIANVYRKKRRGPKDITIMMMFVILLSALAFVALNGIVKERVFLVALVAFISPLPILFTHHQLLGIQKNIVLLSVFVLACTLDKQSYAIAKEHRKSVNIYEGQSSMVDKYLSDGNNKVRGYFNDFRSELQNPYEISTHFHTGKIEGAGWLTNIPFHKGKFESFNDYIDGYGLLVSKKRYPSAVSLISESILLNYQKTVEPKIVAECNDSVIVEFNLAADPESHPSP